MNTSAPTTPYLILNRNVIEKNIERLQKHLAPLNVSLRPHVKTPKSLEVAKLIFPRTPGPITVSTLAEAEIFAEAGYNDIVYAVGIAPQKLNRIMKLHDKGVDIAILIDNIEQATEVSRFSRENNLPIPTLIEIDCDGHRDGIQPEDKLLLEIANMLDGAEVRGVLTHAGESYFCYTERSRVAAAENERFAAVTAAQRLRFEGYNAPVVSIGSTPTAHATQDLTGVTDVRAGNFVFFDLVMAGIGVCNISDIALSVVATVIGYRKDKGWIIIDAGWTALSNDRGTSKQSVDQGFGVVATSEGQVIPDLIVVNVTQEHGVLAIREGSKLPLPDIPVGTELHILPNHACATASQHNAYHVVSKGADDIEAVWERVHGW